MKTFIYIYIYIYTRAPLYIYIYIYTCAPLYIDDRPYTDMGAHVYILARTSIYWRARQ